MEEIIVNEGGKDYYYTETDTQIILKSVHKNRYGLHTKLRFPKQSSEDELVNKAIEDFMVREII